MRHLCLRIALVLLAGCATESWQTRYLREMAAMCEADPTMCAREYEYKFNYQNSTNPRCSAVLEQTMAHIAIAERRVQSEQPLYAPLPVPVIIFGQH